MCIVCIEKTWLDQRVSELASLEVPFHSSSSSFLLLYYIIIIYYKLIIIVDLLATTNPRIYNINTALITIITTL